MYYRFFGSDGPLGTICIHHGADSELSTLVMDDGSSQEDSLSWTSSKTDAFPRPQV